MSRYSWVALSLSVCWFWSVAPVSLCCLTWALQVPRHVNQSVMQHLRQSCVCSSSRFFQVFFSNRRIGRQISSSTAIVLHHASRFFGVLCHPKLNRPNTGKRRLTLPCSTHSLFLPTCTRTLSLFSSSSSCCASSRHESQPFILS